MAIKITLSLLVLSAVFFYSGRGQTGCTKTLMGLSPCLNYVTGNASTPTPTCCSQLSNVVKTQPQCLCLLLNGTASSSGFNINQTLALQLPTACSVQTPSMSKCNAVNGPSASPPADASEQPAGDIPSGSKTVPTVNGAGHVAAGYANVVALLLLFIASSSALSVSGF